MHLNRVFHTPCLVRYTHPTVEIVALPTADFASIPPNPTISSTAVAWFSRAEPLARNSFRNPLGSGEPSYGQARSRIERWPIGTITTFSE